MCFSSSTVFPFESIFVLISVIHFSWSFEKCINVKADIVATKIKPKIKIFLFILLLFHYIQLHFQIVDDKLLAVWGVFTHVELQQGLNRSGFV